MDFKLTLAQPELEDRAQDLLGREVVPIVKRVPDGKRLGAPELRAIYKALAPVGYVGSTIPRDDGGAGMSYVDYGLLLAALARGPVLLGEVVPPRTIAIFGSGEQKRRWLPKLLSGDWISTAAITEPQAGSDVRNLQTTAIPKGDQLLVNGRQKWIKLGSISDLMTVLVVTNPAKGAKAGTTRIIVERSRAPWKAVDIDTVGIRNLPLSEVWFEDYPLPRDNVLGEPGGGTEAFYRGVEASRAFVGMQSVGIAQDALDRAVKYVRERVAFGRPIGKFQLIQGALADAAAELDAARLLCLRALAIMDTGKRCPRETSMAKVYATEAAVRICHTAMDCMGSHGLSEEAGVEERWRDARMLTVIDGTSGIQRLLIGRELIGMPAFV